MTGSEIAAAGKALEIAGKKALGHDEKTKEALLKAAEDSPEMKAAARSMAARVAVKERVLLKLYQPFARMIGVSKVYFEDKFPEEMAEKMATIPDKDLITPPASTVVPALQGLSYSFDEPNLRELYLNLLTTAADGRRASSAHPAFAEVIKQLSSTEVALLNVYLPSDSLIPIVNYEYNLEGGARRTGLAHVLSTVDLNSNAPVEVPQTAAWVANWIRLGLFEVTYIETLTSPGIYDWAESRPEYLRLEAERDEARGEVGTDVEKGILKRTAFGKMFYEAVSPPPGVLAPPA